MPDDDEATGHPKPIVRSQHVDPKKLETARGRRRRQTPSERRAWNIVRRKGLLGLKFHREQTIDGFCVDLYCAKLRVSIEIDGGVHDDPAQIEEDAQRTAVLERLRIKLLRIPAESVSRESLEDLLRPLLASRPAPKKRRC